MGNPMKRRYKLYNQDCLRVAQELQSNSIDAIVTDPPYGLGFMGKDWDHGLPGKLYWEHLLRVAKPGAMLLAFGGTRTYHRLVCAIEDGGWQIRDCLQWIYGSGFPKSHNISKAIDKAGGGRGMTANDRRGFAEELKRKREVAGVSRSQLASWFPYKEVTKNWERLDDGFRAPSEVDYAVLVDRIEVSEEWRPHVRAEDKRRLVKADKTDRRNDGTVIGLGHPGKEWEAVTEAAKRWDGYGTALKPAHEPICLAMKPLDGTFAQNAQEWGVAGLAIDACRVALDGDYKCKANGRPSQTGLSDNYDVANANQPDTVGRWPANIIHDGSDEVVARLPNDSARFFYCAKANKKERGEGNTHPTVKPLALMRYLCQLVSMPERGVILDPFMGSGTTGVACASLGLRFVGCENDTENGYFEIAQGKIKEAYTREDESE